MNNTITTHSLLMAAAVCFGIVACDAPNEDGSKSASSGEATPDKGAKGDTKPASDKPEPKPVEMVDHDLTSAHADWKGWVAKGPKDAKVLADGLKGARIAAKGPGLMDRKKGGDNGFDVAFAPGKQDLKPLKTNLEKGAANSSGDTKMTLTFTKNEAGMLEWTAEVAGFKTYSFVKHIQVDAKDYTCKNNYMVGSGNEAEHKRVLEACGSLKKK